MSEFQYYEFVALDRPLDDADRKALRALSSRARISATQFVNSYEWGNFRGDPVDLMKRWFDLHLYWANWGTRQFMLRVPLRFVDVATLDRVVDDVDAVRLQTTDDHVIIDIASQEEGGDGRYGHGDDDDGDPSGGALSALAPLRADLMNGDLRLLYIPWLVAVENGGLADDVLEPLPGIGPLTAPLETLADLIRVDPDLLQAAAESGPVRAEPSARPVESLIAGLTDEQKTALLVRLFHAGPHAAAELRLELRRSLSPGAASGPPLRSVGVLRARAAAIRADRERTEAEAQAWLARKQAEAEKSARRAALDSLAKRGEAVWQEIEREIGRRNPPGYEKALRLLSDLKTLAAERGQTAGFHDRVAAIRERHARKSQFIQALSALGM